MNDGIEFDDSRMATPQSLRRSNPGSGAGSGTPNAGTGILTSRLPPSTTRVPLKGTPDLRRFRSRNGTPLRKSLVFSFDSPEKEAETIRNLKIISDDNKFQPGNSPKALPNYKIRPLSIDTGDIEFDSSDHESPIKRPRDDRANVSNERVKVNTKNDRVTQNEIISSTKPVLAPKTPQRDLEIEKLAQEIRSDQLAMTNERIMEKIHTNFELLVQKDQTVDSDDDSSELLQELTSHLPRSEIRENSDRIGSKNDEFVRRPISKVSSPVKMVEEEPKRVYGLLSGQYARLVMRRRREEKEENEGKKEERSEREEIAKDLSTERNGIVTRRYADWPPQNWMKLRKLLSLKKITKDAIINSDMVLRYLNCSSKKELSDRIQYLTQYEKRTRRSKKSNRVSK